MTHDISTTTSPDIEPEPMASGVLTFLIADVRGYTRFTQDRGDEMGARLAARFAAITREVVSDRRGQLIELRGDEALAVFSSTRQALRAAIDLQHAYTQATVHDAELPLPVGIGLDAGEAVQVEGGYRGGALNLAARLCSQAGPGEILASGTVAALARHVDGVTYVRRQTVRLKGFTDEVEVVAVEPGDESTPTSASGSGPSTYTAPATAWPIGGFLGATPDRKLAARSDEMNAIVAAMRAAESGKGRLMLLAGEPGVGKTRLEQEASVLVRERGFLVATAACFEQRQTLPFYPFGQVLTQLYLAAPADLQTEVAYRWPYLGRLLPDVGISDIPGSGAGAEEQERLFRAVTAFLLGLASIRPIAIMIDDLQWSDSASLELLEHIARATRAARVFILAAYRDVDAPPNETMDALLLSLGRQQLARWLAIRPLDEKDTGELLRLALEGEPPPELVSLLHRRTKGNAYFLQEVLNSLIDRGDVYRVDGAWSMRHLRDVQVPERVRAIIDQRLRRLSDTTRSTVQEASVMGQHFSFDDLVAMSDRPEGEIERAVEEALRCDVVRELEGDQYVFAHPLVRQTLYDDLPGRRRRRLHLAAGSALEQRPEAERAGRAAELAWHFLQGDDSARARQYETLAGDEAEQLYAHSEAERHYVAALEVEAPRGTAAEARILDKLGDVRRIMGNLDGALEAFERAAQIYDAEHDFEGERCAVANIGLVLARLERADEGLARLEPLLGAAGHSAPTPGLARLVATRAQLLGAVSRFPESLEVAEEALRLARSIGDEAVVAAAEVRRGEALAMVGRLDESRCVLEDIMPVAERYDPGLLVRALVLTGLAAAVAGSFETARPNLERAIELAERIDDPLALANALSGLGNLLVVSGDWLGARAAFERSMEIVSELQMPASVLRRVVTAARLSLMEGKDDALSQLDNLIVEAEREGDRFALQFASLARADVDLLEGRPEVARDRLEPLLAGLDVTHPDSSLFMLALARAYALSGNISGAEDLTDQALERVRAGRNRLAMVDAFKTRGILRGEQGRVVEAKNLFDAALTLAQSMPYPHQCGLIRYYQAELFKREGELDLASKQLDEAAAIFDRLGARRELAMVETARAELARR